MALGNEELLVRIRGIDGLSAPAKKAEQSLRSLGDQAKRSQIQMNQFGGSFTGISRSMRKWSLGALQQTGYQVGDFAVQVANGTSRMQAFGQQAPQLLQIFGPFGAIAGAAVAIFAAFGVAAEKTTIKTKSAAESLDDLSSTIEVYRRAVESSMMPSAQLLEKFGKFGSEIKRNLDLLRAFRASDAIDSVKFAVNSLSKEMGDLAEDTLFWKEQLSKTPEDADLLSDKIEEMAAKFNLSSTQLSILVKSLAEMKNASSLDETVQSGENFRKILLMIYGSAEKIPPEMRQVVQEVLKANVAAADLATTFDRASGNAQTLTADAIALRVAMARKNWIDEPSIDVANARIQELKDKWAEFKNNLDKTPKAAKALKKVVSQELSPELKRAADLGQSIGQSFENAMMSAVKGTMSVKDAFRAMAADIISELLRVFVVKRMTGFITDAISMAALPTNRPNTGTLGLPNFAGGGYTGSGSRSGGMDGKGGFMAMLHPNESVIDHTKGGGGQIVVNQTINVSTGVQQTVRTEIKSLMPQIAESAKAAVADAKRRGGSYGRAFS